MHLTIQEVQQKTTSSEFQEWKVFLQEEINDRNILYNYLARIAYEVARSNPNIKSKSLNKLKIDHFKIKVGNSVSKSSKKTKIKSTSENSKKLWLAGFQIDPDKKQKRRNR